MRAFSCYSHEMAHEFFAERNGITLNTKLKFNDWNRGFPNYTRDAYYAPIRMGVNGKKTATLMNEGKKIPISSEELFNTTLAGPNQNELNAYKNLERTTLENKKDIFSSALFIEDKTSDLVQLFLAGIKDREMPQNKSTFMEITNNALVKGYNSDPDNITQYLKSKNINLTKKDYLKQILLADFLSSNIYESAANIFKYVKNGEKTAVPAKFNIKGISATLPNIYHFITNQGGYYLISTTINSEKNNPFQIDFGTDVDFIFPGKVKQKRIGAKVYNIDLGGFNSDFCYYFNNNNNSYGYLFAFETSKQIFGIKPTLKIQYNKCDFIENKIKNNKNGFLTSAGIEIKI